MYLAEKQIDERSLVLRLIDGDEDAFCELYASYKNRLIYFAMRFLKSREYAEDVFQDAFTVIWQGRRFINPDTSFSSYLYTIVRNRVYTEDTKHRIMADDLRHLIACAMQQLTVRQREVFRMSREKQMSHQEIADALGISINTVQEHISTSLRVLRVYLEKHKVLGADLILLLICLNL